ncbi:MAG: nicotinate-nucleotide adenylyltransferase [Clostridiales bacterium]|nr:nicotinate-nucleotide adenylyltransferase [Clostridiales bacterium]
MENIGIMGGTFDPIHLGHLALAETVRDELDLDKVIFVPTGEPPHKDNGNLGSGEDRFYMTVLACKDNPCFEVSRIELDREGTTYSVDTVKALKELYPVDTKFYFILGADSLMELENWREPKTLMSLCSFAAVGRPGFKGKKVESQIKKLREKYKADIVYVEGIRLEISSTDIRTKIASGKSVRYIIPESISEYIENKGLYGFKPEFYPEMGVFKKKLKKELKPGRYIHTLGVAEEAVKLAEIFGEDKHKAYTAGLLHDCAKNFDTKRTFKFCDEYNVALDNILREQPDLIHSFLGAAVAEHEYGIKDGDTLNAIRYHTTGRADMSRLEEIVYLADMTEPNRTFYEGLDKIRELSYHNLKEAVAEALKQTINFNREKGRIVHPLSLEAFEFYKQFLREEII